MISELFQKYTIGFFQNRIYFNAKYAVFLDGGTTKQYVNMCMESSNIHWRCNFFRHHGGMVVCRDHFQMHRHLCNLILDLRPIFVEYILNYFIQRRGFVDPCLDRTNFGMDDHHIVRNNPEGIHHYMGNLTGTYHGQPNIFLYIQCHDNKR